MVVSAVHLHKTKNVSFWDAMILQSAITAGCSIVLSEDLQDGFRINEMVVENPFKNFAYLSSAGKIFNPSSRAASQSL